MPPSGTELSIPIPTPIAAPSPRVDLSLHNASTGSTPYRLVQLLEGQSTVRPPNLLGDPHTVSESYAFELRYRARQTPAPHPEHRAEIAVLDALRYFSVNAGGDRDLELADDRLRMVEGGKVTSDLRGAQPKEDLTPRMLLDRPFAIVIDAPGDAPLDVVMRGKPAVRRFYLGLPIRSALRQAAMGRPAGPVAPGDTWTARRFPANPLGNLGLPLDIEHTLSGFHELAGVACAWITFQSEIEAEDVSSEHGFRFDKVIAEVHGEASIALEDGSLRRLRVVEEVRASYHRGLERSSTEHRGRYRSEVRIDVVSHDAGGFFWSDGDPRFAAP